MKNPFSPSTQNTGWRPIPKNSRNKNVCIDYDSNHFRRDRAQAMAAFASDRLRPALRACVRTFANRPSN